MNARNERDGDERRGFAVWALRDQRSDGEDPEEQRGKDERQRQLRPAIELGIPPDVENQRADVGQHKQAAPGFAGDHDDGSDIKKGDVREELEFLVLAG